MAASLTNVVVCGIQKLGIFTNLLGHKEPALGKTIMYKKGNQQHANNLQKESNDRTKHLDDPSCQGENQ